MQIENKIWPKLLIVKHQPLQTWRPKENIVAGGSLKSIDSNAIPLLPSSPATLICSSILLLAATRTDFNYFAVSFSHEAFHFLLDHRRREERDEDTVRRVLQGGGLGLLLRRRDRPLRSLRPACAPGEQAGR